MKSVEINNETSRDLYIKVTVSMKIIEAKSRTTRFVSVDSTNDIDTVIINIKE